MILSGYLYIFHGNIIDCYIENHILRKPFIGYYQAGLYNMEKCELLQNTSDPDGSFPYDFIAFYNDMKRRMRTSEKFSFERGYMQMVWEKEAEYDLAYKHVR